jgi:hypothetical protein
LTAEPTYKSNKSTPGNQRLESVERALTATVELKKKALRAEQQDKAASERLRGASGTSAGGVLPQVKIRLNISAPAAAHGSLREAVTLTGGSVIDDISVRQNSLRARIPEVRMGELLERLGRLGTLVERPRAGDSDGMVEIEIIW